MSRGARRYHKYGAKKAECLQGHVHPSRVEARKCNELHLLQAAGEIKDLQHEVQFWFVVNGDQLKHANGRRAGFKVDFLYTEVATGQQVALEVKGRVVRDFPLRRALFCHLHPQIRYMETRR